MTEMVRIDNFGKIFIPKRYREKLTETEFQIAIRGQEIVLRPVRHPLSLYGALKGLKRSGLDEVHGEGDHEDIA
jgi:bifunctional DNA-binding transcriptional regulator/antitoxin component of YhaV-PrlF toxin-antitoxin module